MDRHLVISSDCHAGLPPGGYREYLDPQYRDAFDAAMKIQVERTRELEKHFLVGDINAQWRTGNEAALTGAWDHGERIKVLDGDGIAGEVIFPDGITEMNAPPFGAGIGLSPKGADRELQWAGARAHNRWLAEFCQMAPERRAGVAIVPATWDIDEAIREVRWARENGLRSIMIPVIWGDHAPYHHPCYDPLWATCQDLETVVHFHSGPADSEQYFGAWPPNPGEPTLRGAMGIYVSEVCWWVARPLTFLIWGGIFEEHPELRVAITEGTAQWVPSFLQLLDQRASSHPGSSKLGDYTSHLSMKPSEYFARNIRVGASIPRPEVMMRHQIGVASLMWGSDYPHPEGTWPNTAARLADSFVGVPEDEIAAILGGNAVEFYGFDSEKLVSIAAAVGPEKSAFTA
ncbi:MAG: amidohydrolase family protein [Myxococcales bacterium]|nr:amidohydrolase family protein [Myxococcales bacterium]